MPVANESLPSWSKETSKTGAHDSLEAKRHKSPNALYSLREDSEKKFDSLLEGFFRVL